MKKFLVYHNPRCSKSRETLALLRDKGLEVDVVEYLNTPPSAEELRTLVKKLNITPLEMMRDNEATFKELQLNDGSHSDEQLIEAMAKHPILIQRPIVIHGNKAVIARPPEKVTSLF